MIKINIETLKKSLKAFLQLQVILKTVILV